MSQLTTTVSSARESEQAIDRSSQPRAWSIFTLLPYITIAAYAAMIFWRLPGMLRYEGDDYMHTRLSAYTDLPTTISGYVHFASASRGYMEWSYKYFYDLANHNLDIPTYCFIGLFIVSAIYLYKVLRNCTSMPASLIGALMYLSFFEKHGAILTYNASLFIVNVFIAVVIANTLTSKLSRGAQCAIIAPLYWLSLHTYEILIVLVPPISLIWLTPSLIKRKLPSRRDCVYSSIPWIITAEHMLLLCVNKSHIWDRNALQKTSLGTFPHDLFNLFCININEMFGGQHWQPIQFSLPNFFKFDLRADHSLWLPFLASAICSVLVAMNVWQSTGKKPNSDSAAGSNDFEDKKKYTRMGLLATGLYLTFFGALIIVAEYTREVPTRMLLLPSLGLAIAVAAGLSLIANKRIYQICATIAIAWCLVEAMMFSDLVRQHIDSREIDKSITLQIFSFTPPFRLKPGDNVFISLPYTEKRYHFWAQCHPRYYTAEPVCLWATYHLGFNQITFANQMRPESSLQPSGMYTWMRQTLKHSQASQLCPFYLDDKQKLRPITTISIVDKHGKLQRRIPTELNGQVAPSLAMDMKLLPDIE